MATKGLSLHIGVNSVDPNHYGGWSGPLNACEADAEDLHQVAANQGFEPQQLLTTQATRSNVISLVKEAAEILSYGDIYLLTYSGHGGQAPDGLLGDGLAPAP